LTMGIHGVSRRFKRGVCEAELAVCRMPPEDATCLQARGEEIQVIDALAAQLRKVISEATGKGGRFSGDVAPGSADVILLDKIGRLIREQDVRDQIRHSTWRTMNAVSAVILHQVETFAFWPLESHVSLDLVNSSLSSFAFQFGS